MDKKYIILLGILGVLGVIALFVLMGGGSGKSGATADNPNFEFDKWDVISEDSAMQSEAATLFDGETYLSYEKIIELAKSGRLNLVSELWKLRRRCPSVPEEGSQDEKREARRKCNNLIRTFIMSNWKAPGNQHLHDIMVKYLQYEERMTALQVPEDASHQDRYEAIKNLRKQIFGPEDANLIFGLQEAKMNYSFNFKDWKEKTANLSGDERMKKYEEMRKEMYGDYYKAVLEKEPPFSRYQTELFLRENDLKGLDNSARDGKVYAMRAQYFGKAAAERMAAEDKKVMERDAKTKAYEDAEQKLLAENTNMSDMEKERRLTELRTQHFGREEAEAYTRRRKYQEYIESLKKQ